MNSAQSASPGPIAFIGLGAMGMPMTAQLLAHGFRVRGADLSAEARNAFAAKGGEAFAQPAEAARDCPIAITMLPTSAIVRRVVLGEGGIAAVMRPGSVLVDMSSSVPLETQRLAADLAERGIEVVDAPVSGGVARATDGTLAIMVGGKPEIRELVAPVLTAMGKKVIPVGAVGSGHAAKVLNNYVSACGLLAACEALIVARKFGIDGEVLVDVLNASTGRSNSTDGELKPFVLSEKFNRASPSPSAPRTSALRRALPLASRPTPRACVPPPICGRPPPPTLGPPPITPRSSRIWRTG